MIISQAAWMAGFTLMFGAVEKVKESFQSLIDTQTAVSRAMRTIRSEFHSQAQRYDCQSALRHDRGHRDDILYCF